MIKIDWNGHQPDPEAEKIAFDAEVTREQALRVAKQAAHQPEIAQVAAAVRTKGFTFIYRDGTYVYLGKDLSEEEVIKALGMNNMRTLVVKPRILRN